MSVNVAQVRTSQPSSRTSPLPSRLYRGLRRFSAPLKVFVLRIGGCALRRLLLACGRCRRPRLWTGHALERYQIRDAFIDFVSHRNAVSNVAGLRLRSRKLPAGRSPELLLVYRTEQPWRLDWHEVRAS